MKIYVAHSSDLDFKSELYRPLRESQLNQIHEIILPHEGAKASEVHSTREIIKTCDVIIAEVSFPSTGLGIELGWANIYKRPIICMYRKGSKVSRSLKVVCSNLIEYTDKNSLIKKIEAALSGLEFK